MKLNYQKSKKMAARYVYDSERQLSVMPNTIHVMFLLQEHVLETGEYALKKTALVNLVKDRLSLQTHTMYRALSKLVEGGYLIRIKSYYLILPNRITMFPAHYELNKAYIKLCTMAKDSDTVIADLVEQLKYYCKHTAEKLNTIKEAEKRREEVSEELDEASNGWFKLSANADIHGF